MALCAAAGAADAGTGRGLPPDAVVTPLPSRQVLDVRGPIGPRFADDIGGLLRRYPATRVLVLDSPGGMRGPALEVARLANAHNLTVRIAGRCASACSLLWASADSREMTPGSRVGLHRSYLALPVPLPGFIEARIVARNNRETDRALRRAGFSPRLIEIGARTAPTEVSWLAADELAREGVAFALHAGAAHRQAAGAGGAHHGAAASAP